MACLQSGGDLPRRHTEYARRNGTYVNREPVASATLSNGDEAQLGKFRLVFLIGRPQAAN